MRSLKVRFALLLGSTAALVILAALGVLGSIGAAERTIDRTLAAQGRLELLVELSGRMTQYGLAALEAVSNPDAQPEGLSVARTNVDRALVAVDEALGRSIAVSDDPLDRTQYAARSRPLAQLRSARAVLDRQVAQVLRRSDDEQRKSAIRGALNGFGAMTGQPLSFLIEVERRSMIAGSDAARELSATLRLASLAAVAAALAILFGLYRGVTRPTLARIAAVRQAASAVGRGELDTRLSVATRDELGLLVANFNRMAARLARREGRLAADRAALEDTVAARTTDLRAANERLEAVDRSRRRFFADVSHELRTPLTVILGECDIAARSAGRPGTDYGPVFATIRKRALRLQRRVEDLLRVARSESGQIELDRRPVLASAILTDAVEGMTSEAARRRVTLVLEPILADATLLADREWLRQVLESLVDNALRHASGLTRVTLALGVLPGGAATLTVTDDGPGFSQAGEALFERFHRESPSGETGFGIGLALARWVVERHDGTIQLGAGPSGRGARVSLTLPVFDAATMSPHQIEKETTA
ncbi:Adaptive-response sensory-kinase SasA [Methylobacterium adhaesivum]|jgi:signal transduction histidine kinase|uniref:histidine kinase n=1 Tax=Methylobacterium adhaesivum TaxID=333297 RepID=A0ABT8BB57_9HYPH|nr:ATP-binding protein [Methylobacterium adhaesivum]MDN3589156.1 ATP-binding protein [Methylobacterium adhaesivum]GJD33055.1 Adaptive-response sensory-kinase SasA [Methylobacterium adhaesivum]